jgi:hypothetical protein
MIWGLHPWRASLKKISSPSLSESTLFPMESRWTVNAVIGLCWVVLPLLVVICHAVHFADCFRWSFWKPIPPTILGTLRIDKPNVRVFDLSLYNGEAFYLLIRLRTLSRVMTRFFISHANCTFSGRHNHPVTFAPYESEIAHFGDFASAGSSWRAVLSFLSGGRFRSLLRDPRNIARAERLLTELFISVDQGNSQVYSFFLLNVYGSFT